MAYNTSTSSGTGSRSDDLTVIIITVATCGPCNTLKQSGTLGKITTSLQEKGVTIQSYVLPNFGAKLKETDKLTAYINRKLLHWFPFFAVIPREVVAKLNAGTLSLTDDEISRLVGVFNGTYSGPQGFVNTPVYPSIGQDTVARWLADYNKYRETPKYTEVLAKTTTQVAPLVISRSPTTRVVPSPTSTTSQLPGLQVPSHTQTFAGSTSGTSTAQATCQNIGFTLMPRRK